MFEDTNVLTDQLADCLKEPQKPLFEMKAIAIVVAGLLLINIAVSPWILRFRSGANNFFKHCVHGHISESATVMLVTL